MSATGRKWRVGPNGEPIDGKRPGWFSWRHRTREAHDAAREAWIAAHPHSTAARRRST